MISELRTLLAVARHGTFSAAGSRIGLTQAAVSGQMRRLEEHLRMQLFERTGRSARLNEAGWRTVERASEIVASFDALASPPPDELREVSLRIGAIASVQSTLLARALLPFRSRFPRCQVHVTPDVSLRLLDRVDAGDIDLAILIRPAFELTNDLAWTGLTAEPYVLLAPASVGGDDWRTLLRQQPFIRYDRASFGGRQVDRVLRNASMAVQDWLEVDDLQALVSMVAHGQGVAIVPMSQSILPLPDAIRSLPLDGLELHREVGVLTRASALSSVAASLVEFLRSAVAPSTDRSDARP
jgi:DNA-binding transcriptional LysR family regulator